MNRKYHDGVNWAKWNIVLQIKRWQRCKRRSSRLGCNLVGSLNAHLVLTLQGNVGAVQQTLLNTSRLFWGRCEGGCALFIYSKLCDKNIRWLQSRLKNQEPGSELVRFILAWGLKPRNTQWHDPKTRITGIPVTGWSTDASLKTFKTVLKVTETTVMTVFL